MNAKLYKVHEIYKKHNLEKQLEYKLEYLESHKETSIFLNRCNCGAWSYAVVEYGRPNELEFDDSDSDQFLALTLKKAVALTPEWQKELEVFLKKKCKISDNRWKEIKELP